MRGDNFKPVSADTASWALQQHFALQAVPIDVCGPVAAWPIIQRQRPAKPKPERQVKLTKLSKRILLEVCEANNRPWTLILIPYGTGKVIDVRREFWARCRAEITIGDKPASYAWIGRQTGHHSTTVIHGVREHRKRIAAENAKKSVELTAKRGQNQSRTRSVVAPRAHFATT
jgi:hypothetical protein